MPYTVSTPEQQEINKVVEVFLWDCHDGEQHTPFLRRLYANLYAILRFTYAVCYFVRRFCRHWLICLGFALSVTPRATQTAQHDTSAAPDLSMLWWWYVGSHFDPAPDSSEDRYHILVKHTHVKQPPATNISPSDVASSR